MKIQQEIEKKLIEAFSPIYLNVKNESGMHRAQLGAESHFKVTIVSEQFLDKPLITRHREVNKALDFELKNNIHALAIHTYTLPEWNDIAKQAPATPSCLGKGQ